MPTFDVTLLHDVSSNQRIEAATPSDAIDTACENAPRTLCHHCSNRYDIGDVVKAIVSDESGDEVLVDHMGGVSAEWLPIDQANRGETHLVNDTSGQTGSQWAAAKYIESPEWSGWVYDDDVLNDTYPGGPQPTHYYTLPPVPGT